jgi:hypothetical protein
MSDSNGLLLTRHGHGRFIFYKLMTAIPVFAAVLAIVRHAESLLWLAAYAGVCLTHVAIMYLSKCPHCHYYRTGDSKIHRCFFIWGTPKIRRPDSGPAPSFLAIYTPLAILTLTGFPIYWLRFEWELLVVYLLSITTLLFSILLQECSRCPSFGCPNNKVPEHLRTISPTPCCGERCTEER